MSSPYRSRAPVNAADARVAVYGPFPVRWAPIIAACVCVLLGGISSLVGWDRGVLRCDRAQDRCTYFRTTLVNTRPRSFALSDLKGVEVKQVQSNRSTLGQVELDLGTRRMAFSRTSVAAAEATASQLREALRQDAPNFEVWQHGQRLLGVFGLVCLGFAGLLFFMGGRESGRIHFTIRDSRITWKRTLFGVPLSRGELDAHGARDVHVEWSKRSHFFQHRHALPETFGRLRIVFADGTSRPIVPSAFRGHEMHLQAAAALRTSLDLAPRSESSEREQAHLADAARPPEVPKAWSGPGGRFAAAWTGMCVGSLGGLLLLAVFKIGVGLARIDDSFTDWDALIGGGGGAVIGALLMLRWTRTR